MLGPSAVSGWPQQNIIANRNPSGGTAQSPSAMGSLLRRHAAITERATAIQIIGE